MSVQFPLVLEGLHFATVKNIEEGSKVQTKKGLVNRLWVTFVTRDGIRIKESILVFPGSRKMEQLKTATVGRLMRGFISSQIIDCECVIEVKHQFNGMNYVAYVTDFYDADDFEEVPDEDE